MSLLPGIVTSAQAQGPRKTQEDFIVHVPYRSYFGSCHLIGVLDGHNGARAAQYCRDTIADIFDYAEHDTEKALKELVARLAEETAREESGTTLSLAHVDEYRRTATVAYLGDSPIVVAMSEGTDDVYRSADHNARTNVAERAAALERGGAYSPGGYLYRAPDGDDEVQVTRALGDRNLGDVLSHEPETRVISGLTHKSVIIVASDGLYDPTHEDEERAEMQDFMVREARKRATASDILAWRESQGLRDNASVIVWRPSTWWERLSPWQW